MKNTTSMNWKVLVGLLTVGLISGSAFTFTKLLADELTTVSLAQGRLTTAAVAVVAVMALRREPVVVTPVAIVRLSILALLDGVIPYVLLSWAAGSVAAGLAGVLISTMPLFTAVFATIASRDESISSSAVFGIAVGATGVAVLAGPQALDFSSGSGSGFGVLAVIASAACYAAGTVYARFLLRNGDPVTLTGLKLTIAALILAPLTIAMDGGTGVASLSPQGWASLVALGVGATGLGRCLYLWVLRSAGSVRASMVTYVTPLVGVALGWLVMGEGIGLTMIAGGALVAIGVACVTHGRRLPLERLPRIPFVLGGARGTPRLLQFVQNRPQRPPA